MSPWLKEIYQCISLIHPNPSTWLRTQFLLPSSYTLFLSSALLSWFFLRFSLPSFLSFFLPPFCCPLFLSFYLPFFLISFHTSSLPLFHTTSLPHLLLPTFYSSFPLPYFLLSSFINTLSSSSLHSARSSFFLSFSLHIFFPSIHNLLLFLPFLPS